MNSPNGIETVLVIMLAVLIGFSLGFSFGLGEGYKSAEEDAVTEGKAEYYLDENHKRQWRWKE